VGDRSTKRAGLCALNIDVDPLMVAGRIGENIHLFLCDRKVIGKSEVLTDQTLEFVNTFDY
jgi:hypothetical protein